MALDQDALRLSIRLPKSGREFVLGVAVFAMVVIGFGLAALFFEQLGEQPIGGALTTKWQSVGPAVGAAAAFLVAAFRLAWRKHQDFVASQVERIADSVTGFKDEVKGEFAVFKDDVSTRLEEVERQVSITNGSVASALQLGLDNQAAIRQSAHEIEKVKAYNRGKAGLPMED
jgi:hypothetical protein